MFICFWSLLQNYLISPPTNVWSAAKELLNAVVRMYYLWNVVLIDKPESKPQTLSPKSQIQNGKGEFGLWADTKILVLEGLSGWETIVKIPALSTPECQGGVQSHSS